jgi:hypothetical protein
MNSFCRKTAASLLIFIVPGFIFSQSIDSIKVLPPEFQAEISIGFNYDFLRSPLRVSFDYPRGYLGLNIPIRYSPPQSLIGNIKQLSGQFPEGKRFEPQASAKQNPNTTIKVDVPMLGGVATFSNMQMMYLKYVNRLSVPKLEAGTQEGGDISLFLRGVVSVPVDLSISWETMTFGYAYKINDNVRFAFNLHRHVFNFKVAGKVDMDILGKYVVTVKDKGTGLSISLPGELDYSLHNVIDGYYNIEKWTPTLAIKLWRAGIISRFGFKGSASGHLTAQYTVPFFIDPETFSMPALDQKYLTNNLDKLRNNETRDVEFSTDKKMIWNMPQGHTLMFDLIKEKLTISYTKFFGSILMQLYDPFSDKDALTDTTKRLDTLNFGVEASIDHMIILSANFKAIFFNLGIYSMDFGFNDKKNLLSGIKELQSIRFGNGVMTPILNGGLIIGSKVQVLLEVDLLPLTAVKAGVIYYF